MEYFMQPWPWYVAGPLIGIMVPLLLLVANKQFGISSSFRDACAICLPVSNYFRYDVKQHFWRLIFVAGVIIGGLIATNFLSTDEPVYIADNTVATLSEMDIQNSGGLMPDSIFNWQNVFTIQGFLIMIVGGFLIGFGTRYADGCTSGHAIMGMSLLSKTSLIAVIGFFTGGLIITHFVLPLILKL